MNTAPTLSLLPYYTLTPTITTVVDVFVLVVLKNRANKTSVKIMVTYTDIEQ